MNSLHQTILLVEDDTTILENLTYYLELQSYHVISAQDGLEAYELLKREKPNFIITDIEMQGMNGLDFIEKIRAENLKTPVIIISSYTENSKLLRALKLQLIDYIVKPLSSDKIKEALNKVRQLHIAKHSDAKDVLKFGNGYHYDFHSKQLFADQKLIKLSHIQAELLYLFMSNRHNVLDAKDICNYLYNDHTVEYEPSKLRNHISRLRKLLPEHAITNVYSNGYMLTIQQDPSKHHHEP